MEDPEDPGGDLVWTFDLRRHRAQSNVGAEMADKPHSEQLPKDDLFPNQDDLFRHQIS